MAPQPATQDEKRFRREVVCEMPRSGMRTCRIRRNTHSSVDYSDSTSESDGQVPARKLAGRRKWPAGAGRVAQLRS